jgi:hypothetical protein
MIFFRVAVALRMAGKDSNLFNLNSIRPILMKLGINVALGSSYLIYKNGSFTIIRNRDIKFLLSSSLWVSSDVGSCR